MYLDIEIKQTTFRSATAKWELVKILLIPLTNDAPFFNCCVDLKLLTAKKWAEILHDSWDIVAALSRLCEHYLLFASIQILIATSTLAWGVNFPAHLVVVKGTEYYDGKTRRYVDFPITDVLQMMGRAGRPQYDEHGVAVILVHDIKKHFYRKFLYEPFPVESRWLV